MAVVVRKNEIKRPNSLWSGCRTEQSGLKHSCLCVSPPTPAGVISFSCKTSYLFHDVCCLPGTIRSIGVSNFEVQDVKRLLEISKVHPSVVQNSFDPFNQDRVTREFCERNHIQYMGHRYKVKREMYSIRLPRL